MVLTLQQVTQGVLFSYAAGGQYAGVTKDPGRRHQEHEKKHNGIMYYAPTQNMKKAEEKLLEVCPCYKNQQRHSNVREEAGYVYLIV